MLFGFRRDKLERHLAFFKVSPRTCPEEWVSRTLMGQITLSQVYIVLEAVEFFGKFEVLINEVYFFGYRHWRIIGRPLPLGLVN